MANEEDPKKPGEGQPPSETMLQQERDPDEAVFAEQAIHHYISWVLDQIRPGLESALESFGDWTLSQADSKIFDNQGFFAELTRAFLQQMGDLMGGAKSPIAEHLLPILSDPLDEAQRGTGSASQFASEMSRSARDACWYLRDNTTSVLSNQWDALRDLAYEGSTEFIPVLHQFGLPSADFQPQQLTQAMIEEAEKFRATVPKQKEEAQEQQPEAKKQEGQEADQAEKDKQAFDEQEGKKQAS
jgi:hypothetical protein